MVYRIIPTIVNDFSDFVATKTKCLVSTNSGKYCLRIIVLFGPIFFLPTLWIAWTAENIDLLRTSTWPLLLLVHIASFILLACHESDWCVRLCTIVWFLITLMIVIAIIVR